MIFDCDGVLVDSEEISCRVLAEMLTSEGLSLTTEQARGAYQGLLLRDVRGDAERRLERPLPDDWLARYERRREHVFRDELEPVKGAADAVGKVLANGLEVCVASQGKLAKTHLSLSLTGLDRYFPAGRRFSAEQVTRGKPAPDLFLHAAATLGHEPKHCVVVEDTPSGVAAATAAGMRPFGYAAESDEHALREAGAQILHTLDRLPEALCIA